MLKPARQATSLLSWNSFHGLICRGFLSQNLLRHLTPTSVSHCLIGCMRTCDPLAFVLDPRTCCS